jgi:hypothetical protein
LAISEPVTAELVRREPVTAEPAKRGPVLDAKTFRYLGSQLVAVQDLPATPVELPPGKSDKEGKGATGFAGAKAGSVIDALAIVETSLVDEAGARG